MLKEHRQRQAEEREKKEAEERAAREAKASSGELHGGWAVQGALAAASAKAAAGSGEGKASGPPLGRGTLCMSAQSITFEGAHPRAVPCTAMQGGHSLARRASRRAWLRT